MLALDLRKLRLLRPVKTGVMWFDLYSTKTIYDMKYKCGLWFVIIAVGLIVSAVSTSVGFAANPMFMEAEKVKFESASYTYTPSPFKVRLAKKKGIPVEIKTEPSISLTGYLARPADDELSAAVVLLHTCNGLSKHEDMWSKRLVEWGYVVLSVDSFTPRGLDYSCDGREGHYVGPWVRALDAYGAKQYLSSLSFVDPTRIAVMGMSHGGNTVLEVVNQKILEGMAMKPFQAAIAFYPHCGKPESINAPTILLTGDKDSWTPAELCEEYVSKLHSSGDIKLKVFEGAYHAFDHPGIDIVELGYIVRSNPKAAAAASQITREFLEEWLR